MEATYAVMHQCRGTECIKTIEPQAPLHSSHRGGCCVSNLHGFEVLKLFVMRGQIGIDLSGQRAEEASCKQNVTWCALAVSS